MSSIQILKNARSPAPTAVEDGLLPAETAQEFAGKFWFIHNVDAWDYVERPKGAKASDKAYGFLPILNEIRPRAGVQGAAEIRNSEQKVIGLNDSATRAHYLSKGARVYDPADPSLGPWRNYCRSLPSVGGGKAWIFYTDQGGVEFELLGNGRAKVIEASAILRQMRAYLRDNGLCNPLSRHQFQKMLEIEEAALLDTIGRAKSNTHLDDEVKARKSRIESMKAEWERLNKVAEETSSGPRLTPGGSDE